MATLQSQLVLSLRDQVSGRLGAMSKQLGMFQNRMGAMVLPFRGMIGQLALLGGGYLGATAGLSSTIGAAIKFEAAFKDIVKVVDASDEQFENMARTIKKMSTELPLTAVEISQLFAAAGESGVALEELKSFSEMAARVGIAFDMSAGEAGDSLAKLKAQLGLSVEETGLMADAINHLSNSMAARAPQITQYMLRVGKFAEMGGFHRDQVAGIGAAMIASGAQAETAGTAMMNVVRKMTTGDFAKKDQREAAAALGLHLPTLAKQMKKDAPKALKTVLKAIAKAPEEKQIALLSKFFGDEARAFAPLVGNLDLLDKALDSVADRTKYAGSAFREFVARADTVENALKLLRNRIAYQFEGIGARWLPSIKEATSAIGEVLDSLGDRVSIFDKLEVGAKGFMQGLGYDGSIKSMIADLGDLLFGKVDPSEGADRLGQLFVKMERWGKTVREFNDAVRDSSVAQFLGEIAGQGFKLFLAAAGFTMLAGALRKVAKAMLLLSGASAAIAIIKSLAGIGGAMLKMPSLPGGGKAGKTGSNAPTGKGGAPGTGGVFALLRQFAARIPHLLVAGGTAYGAHRFVKETTRDNAAGDAQSATHRRAERDSMSAYDRQRSEIEDMHEDRRGAKALRTGQAQPAVGFWNAPAGQALKGVWDSIKAWESGLADRTGLKVNTGQPEDLRSDLHSLRDAIHQPSGTQKVEVVNQQPPNIHLGGITVYATTNASPQDIATATAARVSAALESQFSNAHLA
ncbi:phage tail tape measure protein [Aquamicrobium zhengzhouense]|uniref:Phage tail tape measure protein n=1 Tax=Aquamicrobium zhengzhouense TaxID=2781738 RepID=A0ABS0SDT4_9HYPH|nr:phage tail tape measure protein [Aquamicrobium zhengzhouense]MBI1620800.1 phage tail tape measure protein [Aquamicrobium zhengzhouense]